MRSTRDPAAVASTTKSERGGGRGIELAGSNVPNVRVESQAWSRETGGRGRAVKYTRGMITAAFIGAAIPIAILLLSSAQQRAVVRSRADSLAVASVNTADRAPGPASANAAVHKVATQLPEHGEKSASASETKWWPGKVDHEASAGRHGPKSKAIALQLKKSIAISLSDNETAAEEGNSTAEDTTEDATDEEVKPADEEVKPADEEVKPADKSGDKVEIRLFMESKCPACKAFSTTFIKKLLDTPNVKDIIDFKFVPWGNGKIMNQQGEIINTTETLTAAMAQAGDDAYLHNLTFFCQHGPKECVGNAWESCIQDTYPDQADFFPVIDCIEKRSCADGQKPPDCSGAPGEVVSSCVDEFGPNMDQGTLLKCAESMQAQRLLLANALETAKLDPPKAWVPWVTIDGKNLGGPDPKTFTDMFLIGEKVCEAYKNKTGREPPAECASFPTTVPSDPYGEDDSGGGGRGAGVNWWIVGISLVAFVGALAAMYFLLYQTKADNDAMEPLHRDTSDWGGVEREEG